MKLLYFFIFVFHSCSYDKNWMHFVYKLDHRGFQTTSLIQWLTSLIQRLISTLKKHTIRVLLPDWWRRSNGSQTFGRRGAGRPASWRSVGAAASVEEGGGGIDGGRGRRRRWSGAARRGGEERSGAAAMR